MLPRQLDKLFNLAVVCLFVGIEHLCGRHVGRRVGIGVAEQRTYGNENASDIVGRAPFVVQNVQTNISVVIDIWMEHSRLEDNTGGLVRVIFCEFDLEEEDAAFP